MLIELSFDILCKIQKKGHLWSTSYCLLTTGQTTLDVLKKYVESQCGDEGAINNKKEKDTCKRCGW